jgi:quercetin dioxygenase-like cupin family protein
MKSRFVVASETRPDSVYFGSISFLSHPASTGARHVTAMEATVTPGQGHDFHKHPDQEEVIYVAAGTLEQWIGREKRILAAGDAVVIPPGVVHASFNAGSDDLRLVVFFAPCVGEGFEAVEVAGEAPWRDLRA